MVEFIMIKTRYFALTLLSLFLAVGDAQAKSTINDVLIVSEGTNSVVLEVHYSYDGRQGNSVFASARMTKGGKMLNQFGYKPGAVTRGRGRTRVVLGVNNRAPDLFESDGLKVQLYRGGGDAFVTKNFVFAKTWAKSRTVLRPALTTIVQMNPVGSALMAKPNAGSCTVSGGEVKRSIRQDGTVRLSYPDGTIVLLTAYGRTVISPDGNSQRLMYANAQPPTPPAAPPNSEHASWIEYEANRLMRIIQTLVGNNQPSINAYLQSEAGLSHYGQVSERTRTIDMLVQP